MRLVHLMASLLLCVMILTYPTASQQKDKPADKTPGAPEEQAPKSIAESVSRNLEYAEGDFLSIAEAMPEEKYGFIPAAGKFDGVRSFAEQVKHVALRTIRLLQRIRRQEAARRLRNGRPGSRPHQAGADQIPEGFIRLWQPHPRDAE